MMNKRTILLVFLILPIASCAILDPTDPYKPADTLKHMPMHRFTSPRPVTQPSTQPASRITRPLSLNDCIHIAIDNNPDISERRYNVREAESNKKIAVGEIFPTISLAGSYKHSTDDQRLMAPRSATDPGVFGDDVFTGDIILKMPIFTGGRILSSIRAATLLNRAAVHSLSRTRKELIFNVSSVFYRILAQRYLIESTQFSIKSIKTHYKRIQDMIDVQKASRVDLLRTGVRLADLREELVRQKNDQSILYRILSNLLGIMDTSGLKLKGRLQLRAVNINLQSSLSSAYENRSDYLAAKMKLEAQAKKVDIERSKRWPTISVEGSYGFRNMPSPTSRPSGADSVRDEGYIGVMAEFPIFEGGRITERIHRERFILGSMQENLRKLKLQIKLDVETSVLNVESARERINATEKAIAQARESFRIEQEKYAVGKGSITDVLDAQSELLRTQTQYYRSLSDYNTAIAQWHLAIGEEK